MLGASLSLVLVVLGSSPPANPAELVAQLGSPRYQMRESAEVALIALGRLALPSLKAARYSTDLEIQMRATGLVARIEDALLVEPTLISCDFENVPIDQAIQAINRKSGLALGLNPEDLASIQGRRLTLKSSAPLPFWKAIDAFCEAGQLHFIAGGQVPLGQREGTFLLFDRLAASTEPVSDSGPFRVHLSSVHYQSEIQLSERRQPFGDRTRRTIALGDSKLGGPDASRQFFLNLMVSSEPRLTIGQNGMVRVTVAVDDKGQSLLVPSNAATFQHMAGYSGMNSSPTVRVRLDLSRPEAAGQRIRLIRGTIPVTVSTRKSDPLEVPIAGSEGKLFRNDEVTLAVHSRPGPKSPVTSLIELAITPMGQAPRPIRLGEGEPLGYRPDTPRQQIEILDAQGNILSWFPSGTFYNGEETRLVLTIVNRQSPPVPALIRYHSLIKATVDVPFEFRDLPMP